MITNSGALGAVNNQVALNVSDQNSAIIYVKGGVVTAVGATITFEGSLDSTNGIDGTWFVINGARTNATTVENVSSAIGLAPGVGSSYGWRVNVSNVAWIRARVTAITSGDLVGVISASPAMSETAPNIGTHAVTGSGTFTTSGTTTNTPLTPTPYNLVTAATTNGANIKATAGTLFELTISNPTATPAYVKLYNKSTAPTVGTDVPIMTIPIAATAAGVGFATVEFGGLGKRFSSGIGIAVTGAAVATDATATVAGIQINGSYV